MRYLLEQEFGQAEGVGQEAAGVVKYKAGFHLIRLSDEV
jgi:hypothetical protein